MLKGVCDPRTPANVLLAGKRGSGKSTALASIAWMLAADPNHVYPRIVNCNRMVGELVVLLHKMIIRFIRKSTFSPQANAPNSCAKSYVNIFPNASVDAPLQCSSMPSTHFARPPMGRSPTPAKISTWPRERWSSAIGSRRLPHPLSIPEWRQI